MTHYTCDGCNQPTQPQEATILQITIDAFDGRLAVDNLHICPACAGNPDQASSLTQSLITSLIQHARKTIKPPSQNTEPF